MPKISESAIEDLAIQRLSELGYAYTPGPVLAPDGLTPLRASYEDELLLDQVTAAVDRLNPHIPPEARAEALRQIQRLHSPELISNNETFHRLLTEGVNVTYQQAGYPRGDYVWLIDFAHPENNEFYVVNQFTLLDNGVNKRPDIVLFVNGLPLVVMELKNPALEGATVKSAYQQIQTYKAAIPSLFRYNALIVISDGLEAKMGSLSAEYGRFMAWKTADGIDEASPLVGQLEFLIRGLLN